MAPLTHPPQKDCIETCWACRHSCQDTLFNHCLLEGGAHTEADHVRLMTDCIQMCQAAADAMVRNSPRHAVICAACADICEACALSCEAIPGDHMKECARTCRECAEQCRRMGTMKQKAA